MDILTKNSYLIAAIAALAGYANFLLITHGLSAELKELIQPSLIIVFFQFLLGYLLGLFFLEKWKIAGISTGIILWCITLYGILTDFYNHNLFPIEIALAILWIVPALFGANLGYKFKTKNEQQ